MLNLATNPDIIIRTLEANAVRFDGREDRPHSVEFIREALRLVRNMNAQGADALLIGQAIRGLKTGIIRKIHARMNAGTLRRDWGKGDINVICALVDKL